MGGVIGNLKGRIRIQDFLDIVEKWSEINQVEFNKEKGKVLDLRGKNHMHKYSLGSSRLGCSTVKNVLGEAEWYNGL